MSGNGYVNTRNVVTILPASTATATGGAFTPTGENPTFHSTIAGTGAVTATVLIEGNMDTTNTSGWTLLQTHTLSGTTTDTTGLTSPTKWANVRARLTAITGTSAAVTVKMGC